MKEGMAVFRWALFGGAVALSYFLGRVAEEAFDHGAYEVFCVSAASVLVSWLSAWFVLPPRIVVYRVDMPRREDRP